MRDSDTTEKAVSRIDAQIEKTQDPRTIAFLIWARGKPIEQDEAAAEGRHRRSQERYSLFVRISFAFATLGSGVGLILAEHTAPGSFLIGGALFWFVPEYVRRYRGRESDDSEDE